MSKAEEVKLSLGDGLKIIESYIKHSFRDENGEPWALYEDKEKIIQRGIETKDFEDWVRVVIAKAKGPTENWVSPIVKTLASKARRNRTIKLHLRMAGGLIENNYIFFYHIGGDRELVIRKGEIDVIEMSPLFRVLSHQGPLSIKRTATKEDINLIDKYLPFANKDDRQLFKSFIPAYFVPDIAKPGIVTTGPPGAAKSTFCRVVKHIFDPNEPINKGGDFPKENRDWMVKCQNHAFFILDNLTYLKQEQQDMLCRVVTGITYEERELYTNKGFMSTAIRGVPLINGIELSGLKSDFLDRNLLFTLERIEPENKIPEERFYKEFFEDLPKIRYAAFLILAEAMEKIKQVQEEQNFRLNDFAQWAEASSIVRGISSEEHHRLFDLKIRLQHDETLTQSQIAEPLLRFMKDTEEWEGTAEELLQEITEQEYGHIEGTGLDERTVVRKTPIDWIKTASSLGKELTRIEPFIKREGVEIVRARSGIGRKIKLKKVSLNLLSHLSHNEVSRRQNSVTGKQEPPVTHPSHPSQTMTDDSRVTAEQKTPVTKQSVPNPQISQPHKIVTGVTEETKIKIIEDKIFLGGQE